MSVILNVLKEIQDKKELQVLRAHTDNKDKKEKEVLLARKKQQSERKK